MRESLRYFQDLELRLKPWVEPLLGESFFYQKVKALEGALSLSRRAYLEKGSFQFCGECARKGIRCCGEGLEWKLSPEEFFLNLCLFKLSGVEFSLKEKEGSCLFLGERGCTLLLTPLFCRNFFCTELSLYLGRENLIYLQNAIEEETLLTFELCEYLKGNNQLKGSVR